MVVAGDLYRVCRRYTEARFAEKTEFAANPTSIAIAANVNSGECRKYPVLPLFLLLLVVVVAAAVVAVEEDMEAGEARLLVVVLGEICRVRRHRTEA